MGTEHQSDEFFYDLAVIGGGINGCGITRDAQGRGLKTLLIEQYDLASATSSSSSKLIHGGLRYLEHYEFKLVREALNEREVLLRQAPHIIWPMKFVLPHSPEQRPAWMIRLGLFLYDFLGTRKHLPRSAGMDLRGAPEGQPLQDWVNKGFSYADLWAQDTRLSILSAMDAKQKGADIHTRTKVTKARRTTDGQAWHLETKDQTGKAQSFCARAIVNAAGPWAGQVDAEVVGRNEPGKIRMVKGSHIVVKKLFDGDQAYILQNDDERVIFAIPYEQHYTLIGTTDVNYEGDPKAARCSDEETSYLCRAINRYFKRQISKEDLVWTYAGVRPLLETEGQDAKKLSRGFSFSLDGGKSQAGWSAPCLSVYGGKLTAFRELAAGALELLAGHISMGPAWTHDGQTLPGGNLKGPDGPTLDFDLALRKFKQDHPFLPSDLAWRYLRNYGMMASDFLREINDLNGMGQNFGHNLYEAELKHLIRHEFAKTGEDVYWRRSRLGLHLSAETMKAVDEWMQLNVPKLQT